MTEWMDNVEMAIAKVSVIHFLRWCWFLLPTRCVPAKSTPRQSSRGRRTTSSPSARTWNELRLRGLWIDLTHRSQLSNEDPNSGCLALKDSYSLDEKNCISLLCLNLSSATQMIPKILMMGAQVADWDPGDFDEGEGCRWTEGWVSKT